MIKEELEGLEALYPVDWLSLLTSTAK